MRVIAWLDDIYSLCCIVRSNSNSIIMKRSCSMYNSVYSKNNIVHITRHKNYANSLNYFIIVIRSSNICIVERFK